MAEPPRIAFIGLGRMGMPMARNLVAADFLVVGCDLAPAARAAFAEVAQVVDTAADAVGAADVIVTHAARRRHRAGCPRRGR